MSTEARIDGQNEESQLSEKWIAIPDRMPWIRRAEPYFVHVLEASRLREELARAGFRCVELDGRSLQSEQDLLDTLGRSLGFPSYYGGSWDAFVDCAGELGGRVALLWKDPEALLGRDLHALVRGVHMLLAAVRDVGGFGDEDAPDLQMEVFLIGEGEVFHNLEHP